MRLAAAEHATIRETVRVVGGSYRTLAGARLLEVLLEAIGSVLD